MCRILLLLVFLVGLASPAHAAIAYVKNATGSAASGTTVSATITPTTAGDLLAIGVTYIAAAATTISTIAGNSNTYVLIDGPISQGSGGTNCTLWTYYVLSANSGSTTITVTFAATIVSAGIVVHEISGANVSTPLDQHHMNGQTNASGTDSYTSGNVTTTASGEYIFGLSTNDNGDTMTAGTGYTIRNTTVLPDTEDQVQGSAGVIAATFTPSNSFSTSVTGIVTFKAAGGGATPPRILLLLGAGGLE